MSIATRDHSDSTSFSGPVGCDRCSQFLPEAEQEFAEHYIPELGQHLCDRCLPSYTESILDQAECYAREACKITAVPWKLNDEFTRAFGQWPCDPTPSQFTAFMLACRSRCTNYDALIRPFANHRGSVANGIYAETIERRINALLTEEARIRGIAVPVESGRIPKTVFVIDAVATPAERRSA